MINWIIIVILVIVGVFAIKMNHLKHRVFIIILIILALFFYASVTYISSKNNLSMNSYNGFVNTMKIYGGWLGNGFGNVRVLTGNAVKMDWTSVNGTLYNKSATNSKPVVYKPGSARVTFKK